jgi:dCMP deaminase
MRPSFDKVYMDLAIGMSQRSTCRRLQVGCAIVSVDYRKVLAVGYNGNASGLNNDCDSDEPGKCGCLHAEENAVINCDVPRATPKVVYCSHLPCAMCAKRLINLGGVVRVIYKEDYRIRDSVKLLHLSKIGVARFIEPNPPAYVELHFEDPQ